MNRILGVDPGCRFAGYGIAQQEGSRVILLESGFLSLSPTKPLVERVGLFHEFFDRKVTEWQVGCIALEVPFLGKNAQNFLKLGYLRGILYLITHHHNLSLAEFTPMQVKQTVTGFGGASKEQVSFMIQRLFPGLEKPAKFDVTDAIAVTLSGLWQQKMAKEKGF